LERGDIVEFLNVRKKAVEIKAVILSTEMTKPGGLDGLPSEVGIADTTDHDFKVKTKEGLVNANVGDVLLIAEDRCWPTDLKYFEENYEEIVDEAQTPGPAAVISIKTAPKLKLAPMTGFKRKN
jgi:hypothetical protein